MSQNEIDDTLSYILEVVERNPQLSSEDIMKMVSHRKHIQSLPVYEKYDYDEKMPEIEFEPFNDTEEQSLLDVQNLQPSIQPNMPPRNEQQGILQPNQIQQIEQPPALNRNNTGRVMVLQGMGRNMGL